MNPIVKMMYTTLMAVMILPSCGTAQLQVVSNLEESFDGIEELVVNGGSLEVSYEGGNQQDVYLSAYLESNKDKGGEVVYRVVGKKLIVEYNPATQVSWGNWRSKGFINFTGPENVSLEISNSSGKMYVSNVSSDKIELKVSSGKMETRNLSGAKISLTSSSGGLDIEGIKGNLDCRASSGGGRISNVQGSVSVAASSGSYIISEVDGTVNAALSSGSLDLNRVKELGALEVSSGSVTARHTGLGKNTYLRGSSGSFTIQTDDDLEVYNYNLSASSGSLEVGDNKTVRKLHIDHGSSSTISGSISSGTISIRN